MVAFLFQMVMHTQVLGEYGKQNIGQCNNYDPCVVHSGVVWVVNARGRARNLRPLTRGFFTSTVVLTNLIPTPTYLITILTYLIPTLTTKLTYLIAILTTTLTYLIPILTTTLTY